MNRDEGHWGCGMKWPVVILGMVGFVVFALSPGAAFVRSRFPPPSGAAVFWPDARTTVSLQFGCPQGQPLPMWGPCWDDAAADALNRWNTFATRFRSLRNALRQPLIRAFIPIASIPLLFLQLSAARLSATLWL